MAKFITLLIERSHRRLLSFILWIVVFCISLGCAAWFTLAQIGGTMQAEAKLTLDPMLRLRADVLSTFDEMKFRLMAEPCSPAYHEQLRSVAFLPDGLNEFLYAPGAVAQCSVAMDFAPHALGTADIVATGPNGISFWFDEPLDFMGLPGHIGTIALRGEHGMVIPRQAMPGTAPYWIKQEIVAVADDGRWWHRSGTEGIFENQAAAGDIGNWLPAHNGAFYSKFCDPAGMHCVVSEAKVGYLIIMGWPSAVAAVVISALLALGIAGQAHTMLGRFWSFEARFRRNFKPESIICTYQPILSLASGTITGCEVLVRWRDVDGTTVFPDQFLPIVERHGLGRELTKFVVEKAYWELSRQIPPHIKLQINFNVFPSDLDAAWLRDTLVIFENSGNRFSMVVEIIESDQVDVAHAQREIESLRRYGIRTYLDDFGSGYSNIQNLASLGVDGVKLDRSFAMASEGSLMARMLGNAIEMIHAAGHAVTVEGVETEDRLRAIKATGQAEFVQGYLISRPLPIERFVQFLGEQGTPMGQRPRLVA